MSIECKIDSRVLRSNKRAIEASCRARLVNCLKSDNEWGSGYEVCFRPAPEASLPSFLLPTMPVLPGIHCKHMLRPFMMTMPDSLLLGFGSKDSVAYFEKGKRRLQRGPARAKNLAESLRVPPTGSAHATRAPSFKRRSRCWPPRRSFLCPLPSRCSPLLMLLSSCLCTIRCVCAAFVLLLFAFGKLPARGTERTVNHSRLRLETAFVWTRGVTESRVSELYFRELAEVGTGKQMLCAPPPVKLGFLFL